MDEASDRYKLLLELSPGQGLALEVIDRGGTHAEAAEVAGVDRTTVSRWMSKHPAFIAERNRRRLDRFREHEERLGVIDRLAIGAIQGEIEDGNIEVAIMWFKARGLAQMTLESIGPTDPVEVINLRKSALPDPIFSFLNDRDGTNILKAIDAVWTDLNGPPDPTVQGRDSWADYLAELEPEDVQNWGKTSTRSWPSTWTLVFR